MRAQETQLATEGHVRLAPLGAVHGAGARGPRCPLLRPISAICGQIFFEKPVSLETLNTCLIGKSRKKFEKIRYICKPNVFNYINYSNNVIKLWFDNFHDSMFIKHATEEFAELYFDDIIIENYFIEIMKIKFFRQS